MSSAALANTASMSGSGEPSRNMWVASGTRSSTARKKVSAVLTPETFRQWDSSSMLCDAIDCGSA
jgi:hypothetical protein